MSMELLGNEFIEEFYPRPPRRTAPRKATHLEGIVGLFPWMATVDAFQHWIYTHAGHTRAERKAACLQLMDRFGGDVDWTGHENRAGQSRGTGNCIFSSIRFTTSNTASRSSARCRSGRIQSGTRRRRWTITKNPSRWAARVRCRNCLRRRAASLNSSAATIRPLTQLLREELAKL